MADRGPVKIRRGRVADLIGVYEQTYKRIVTEILTATAAGKIQRFAVMNRINAELTALGVDVDAWVKQEIPQYYQDGANQAAQDLRALGVDVRTGKATINREAVAALVSDTSLSFAEGIKGVGRSANRLLSNALRQQLNFIAAEGKLTGESLNVVAASVEQELRDNGLSALEYRNGARYQLDDYSEMLIRTKAVESRNQGLINLMVENGQDLVQITDHGSKHKACARWEGKVLSITGATPTGKRLKGGYRVAGTMEEAKIAGLFHPNCEHAANVLNPELAAKTEAYDTKTKQYV